MKIGILGGGQLSQMLALAGIPLGLEFVFYFPQQSHALQTLGTVIHGAYEDAKGLAEFAAQVDVITFENENIPRQTLQQLVEQKPTFPDHNALAVAQDRLLEKQFFIDLGVPTNAFIATDTVADVRAAGQQLGYPFILKKRTQGYDGKGQVKLKDDVEIERLSEADCLQTLAEAYVPFAREVSLIVARSARGLVHYDLCENTHVAGILRKTQNRPQDALQELAFAHVRRIADHLAYTGVLTVEFFQVGQQLLANEMAPRVHNSGHWTIEGSITSQFENHLRAVVNLPLGLTTSLAPVTLLNIIGTMPNKADLLAHNGLCLHDYGKAPAPSRKLGHVTVLGASSEAVMGELL